MGTFAPQVSPRFRFHYIAAHVPHTIQIRAPRGVTIATVQGDYTALAYDCFNLFNASLADDFAWVSAEGCEQDETEFFPIAVPDPVTGTVDTTTWSAVKRIRGLTFSGRAKGSRARLTLFGISLNSDTSTTAGADGILTVAESGPIATLAGELDSFAAAGNGDPARWYRRATIKEFDVLLKHVRRGTIT